MVERVLFNVICHASFQRFYHATKEYGKIAHLHYQSLEQRGKRQGPQAQHYGGGIVAQKTFDWPAWCHNSDQSGNASESQTLTPLSRCRSVY